jgi:hypothetical protein
MAAGSGPVRTCVQQGISGSRKIQLFYGSEDRSIERMKASLAVLVTHGGIDGGSLNHPQKMAVCPIASTNSWKLTGLTT